MSSSNDKIKYFQYNLSCSADNGQIGEKWCYGEERILEMGEKEVNTIHIRNLENWLVGPAQDKLKLGMRFLDPGGTGQFVCSLYPPNVKIDINDPEQVDQYRKQEPIAHIVYLLAEDKCSECKQTVNYGYGVKLKKDFTALEATEEIVEGIDAFQNLLMVGEAKQVNLDGGDLGAGDNI